MLAENDSEQMDCSAKAGTLWPTPSACCANDGEGAATWLARRDLDLNPNPAIRVPENVMTLCDACHTKWHWEHGKKPYRTKATCLWCEHPVEGRGLCGKHLQRAKKYGDPHLSAVKRGNRYVVVTAWD